MQPQQILSLRTKGTKIPITIGSAIAVESFLGISEDKPLPPNERAPYTHYDCILINVRTLLRNILSSLKSNEVPMVLDMDLFHTLIQEMELIKTIVEEETRNRVIVSFYYNSYLKISTVFKNANFKVRYTDKQAILEKKISTVEQILVAQTRLNRYDFTLEQTMLHISRGRRRNVMLTHAPVDLLLHKLPQVDLLESHTGRVKQPHEFNSKLKNADSSVPFNKFTLQLFGDKSHMFETSNSHAKRQVAKICSEKNPSLLIDDRRFFALISANCDDVTKRELLLMK